MERYVRGDISRDTDFSRDKFNLTDPDGLKKEASKCEEKSYELTLVKYSIIRLVIAESQALNAEFSIRGCDTFHPAGRFAYP